MGLDKRYPRSREIGLKRLLPLLLFSLFVVVGVLVLIRTSTLSAPWAYDHDVHDGLLSEIEDELLDVVKKPKIPFQNELSLSLEKRNHLPPRNLDLFPTLKEGHVTIVLYVHNRPQYLRVVVDSLSKVEGIAETLLLVSHDGYFEEMNSIIDRIRFCQVKQIFAPYSPHLFPDSFPGTSSGDCRSKQDAQFDNCTGNPDQYGNHRSPRIVSLKHHWWWMMNTVWDGLVETRRHQGHILFIEEDHYVFPNAYRNIQILTELKQSKCPDCYAANLAPSDVKSKGEQWESLVAEKIGNIGYTFNRTVWRKIHAKALEFCSFDDYNWDITMWAAVYPSWGSHVYTLRGPRRSAAHFGKCGLHQGQEEDRACIDNGNLDINVEDEDKYPNIKTEWGLHVFEQQGDYQAGFKGWGGWGDKRDQQLCMSFASMYHVVDSSHEARSLKHRAKRQPTYESQVKFYTKSSLSL